MSIPNVPAASIPVVFAPEGPDRPPRTTSDSRAADTTAHPHQEERDGIGALSTERGNLPLESIDVAITTTGLAVRTELTQGFRNPYDEPVEATYVFPLPGRSAVTSMVMRAADRTVEGKLDERGQAREQYDQAISAGKRASIAEEERPGVFTMRVGNILPGEDVSVTLTLAGTLPYEDGEATVRFPLVVAPRYIPGEPLAESDVGSGVQPDTDAVPDASRITPPVLLPDFPNPIRLSITAEIDPAGLPIEQATSSLHPVRTEQRDDRFLLRVHPGERADRDFVLRLRLGDPHAISSSLTVVPDTDRSHSDQARIGRDDSDPAESGGPGNGPDNTSGDQQASDDQTDDTTGTFALTLLPPQQVTPPAPRDVVFVLDRSGSMRGWKMVAARRAAGRILDTLTAKDRFAVLTFDNTVDTPEDLPDGLTAATDRQRFRAIEHLARTEARGGTEMLAPLLRATDLFGSAASGSGPTDPPAGDERPRERVLLLLTDGQVGNEDQILSELSDRFAGLRVHTVGIDRAVNEAFLGRLAMLGGGHSEFVESEDRLDVAMDAIHRRIGTPVLTDLEFRPEGLDIDIDSIAPNVLPALYAGTALTVHGRYRGTASGDIGAAIRVIGRTGGRPRAEKLAARPGTHPAMAATWARSRLRDLEDRYVALRGAARSKLEELEQRITEISLQYGVLCRFTAYVAVDSRVVTDGGAPRRVTQPVELPQGWELPPDAPSGARPTGLSASATARPASAALNAPVSRAARASSAPEARSARPPQTAGFGGSRSGSPHGRAAGRRGQWTAPPIDPAVRAEATRLLNAMRSVEPDDRYRWLVETLPALRRLVDMLADAPEGAPLRHICTDLTASVESSDSTDSGTTDSSDPNVVSKADPYHLERFWLRTADVLSALAGVTDTGPTDPAASDTPGSSEASESPAAPDPRPGPARSAQPFWRRSGER